MRMKKVSGIIVFMLAFLGLVGCGNKAQEIDVKDFVSITVTGYSGEGDDEIHFDRSAFEESLLGKYGYDSEKFIAKLSSVDTKEKELKKLVGIRNVVESVDFITIESGMYANGETVRYTLVYDEAAAEEISLTIKDSSEPYIVNGLEELKVLTAEDLKKDVTVEVTGVAPNIDVYVEYVGAIPGVWAKHLTGISRIEDGGFIDVLVDVRSVDLKSLGYKADSGEFMLEFPLEFNERYASKPEEIGEELWARIVKEAKDEFVSEFYAGAYQYIGSKDDTKANMKNADEVGEPVIKEAHILYSKRADGEPINEIGIIFEAHYKGEGYGYNSDYVEANFFVGVYMENLAVDKEGKNEGTLLEAKSTDGNFDYLTIKNKMVTQFMGDYNVIEIPLELLK